MASSLLNRHLPSTMNSSRVSMTRLMSIGAQSWPPQQPTPVVGLRMPEYQSCASAGLKSSSDETAKMRRRIFEVRGPGLATSLLASTGTDDISPGMPRLRPDRMQELYTDSRSTLVSSRQQM